ncbi:MAG: hypothetical protein ABIT71_09185 [Vicinamibacteraceae bacterium]
MTILEIVKEGLYYARTRRSLWLFGFFVGVWSGGSNGGSNDSGGGDAIGGAAAAGLLATSGTLIGSIAVLLGVAALTFLILRFVGEGALIEGVVRARQGVAMTTREGFRAGWAHWGVLIRIALLYLAATLGTLGLLVAICVVAWHLLGVLGAVLLGMPMLVIAVPWLVTIYLVQAFASRIAVLENRRAFDAIGKARLFLHGRLLHGLKLIVATFLGTLAISLVAMVVIVPVALLLVALLPLLHIVPVIFIACLVLVPVACILTAMIGTFRSSVWTIGYLSQVES